MPPAVKKLSAIGFQMDKKKPREGLIGGQGRNRTGVDGFAGRSITTLPPGLGKISRANLRSAIFYYSWPHIATC